MQIEKEEQSTVAASTWRRTESWAPRKVEIEHYDFE